MAQLKEKENIHFVNATISAVMGSDSTKVKTGLPYLLKKHAPITCNGHFKFLLTPKTSGGALALLQWCLKNM